jgi:hypothetical protein
MERVELEPIESYHGCDDASRDDRQYNDYPQPHPIGLRLGDVRKRSEDRE